MKYCSFDMTTEESFCKEIPLKSNSFYFSVLKELERTYLIYEGDPKTFPKKKIFHALKAHEKFSFKHPFGHITICGEDGGCSLWENFYGDEFSSYISYSS